MRDFCDGRHKGGEGRAQSKQFKVQWEQNGARPGGDGMIRKCKAALVVER